MMDAKDAWKDATKNKKEMEAKTKEVKKTKDKADYDSKKSEVCKSLAKDIGKGVLHLCSLLVNK
jgi:hypothetical protein